MEKGKIKAMIVVGFSVVAFILLFVAIVTDYWYSYYNLNTLIHFGLFYKGSRENYYAYEQTVQAFLLIALFLFLAAIVLLILEVIGKKLKLPIERLGENLIHLTNMIVFTAMIIYSTVDSRPTLYDYSFKLAWAAFAINFLSSLILLADKNKGASSTESKNKTAPSIA